MTKISKMLAILGLGCAALVAQDEAERKRFEFELPKVEKPLFADKVAMMEKERAEYATNLATYAGNLTVENKGSAASLHTARQMLAVALHLDPRNREALVLGFQLRKGLLPEKKAGDYSAPVFSRLLLSRARLLAKSEEPRSQLLARCFVEIAATLDPRNEDAVFEFEIQRLDHGETDWDELFNAPRETASPSP